MVGKGQEVDFTLFPVIFINDDAKIPSLILILRIDDCSHLRLLHSAVLLQHVDMFVEVNFGLDLLSA